jgi:hypothetical protein
MHAAPGKTVSAALVFVLAGLPWRHSVGADAVSAETLPRDALCGAVPSERIRQIDFYSYFPTEAQAAEAAARIDGTIFEVTVRTSAASPEWLVRSVYRELPSPAARADDGKTMAALSRAHGGRYEGSGCVLAVPG